MVVLNGGDDYEVLATVPPDLENSYRRAADDAGVRVTRIGTIGQGKGPPTVRDRDGRPIAVTAVSHAHF
jgi:thiamine-monophosphate kinase